MTLQLHNTLTGRTEEFRPQEPGVVRLYTCGPTVWNYSHVGNCRAYLVYDLLRRHLLVSGYRVEHVMNVTDVDDRIIEQASAAGVTIGEFTRPYEEAFLEDLRSLRAQPAEIYPRATGHVEEMMALIERLLEGGHAYEVDGDVYFRIASFPSYGALSHLDRAGLRPGARVATDKYEKESATDFALWKRAGSVDERVGAAWSAPFGRGRPGWHIECSAMAMKYLGETLDVHMGGIDLLFPHHENEVAQSEAATGRPFARYWVHSEHLADATGAKMSKSEGNVATLRDLVAAGHDPLAVRTFLLANAHYRSRLPLTEKNLYDAAEQLRRLRDFADRVRRSEPGLRADDAVLFAGVEDARAAYRAALDDDLNLPAGLGHVFEVVREANAALDAGRVGPAAREALLALLADVDAHLDVLREDPVSLDEAVERLIAEREQARQARDFATADRIRAELRQRGIVLEDSRDGVRWKLTWR
ncbi:MAG TPA: cysteine--tRNA ligase [Candidatus Dormibacteraeota bacterium]|nr:cysteine--tRNA ligase [Candidatus Dormibacteraeota bacterium]